MKYLVTLLILLCSTPALSEPCWVLAIKKWTGLYQGPSQEWIQSGSLVQEGNGYSVMGYPVQFFSSHGNPVLKFERRDQNILFRPTQESLPKFDEYHQRPTSIEKLTREKPVFAYLNYDVEKEHLNVIVLDGHHRTYQFILGWQEPSKPKYIYVEIQGVHDIDEGHRRVGRWGSPIF